MNIKLLIAVATMSLAGPAFADGGAVIDGARLDVYDDLQRTDTHVASDSVGPIKQSFANRSGAVASSADYGSLSTGGTQKLLSLRDGQSAFSSQTFSRWIDTVSTAPDKSNPFFSFHVTTSLAATQTGFSGTKGGGFSDWSVKFDNGAHQTGLRGHYVVNDGSKTAPKPFWYVESFGDLVSYYGGVGSGTAIPVGDQAFVIGFSLASSDWTVVASTSCGAYMNSFRIADALSTKCSVGLKWDGGFAAPFAGGPNVPDFSFQGASGYAYATPYDPPAVGAFRAASSAAAVPEPASWAMMIAGFGLVGAAVRRRGPVAA